jgi:hypothetical protein
MLSRLEIRMASVTIFRPGTSLEPTEHDTWFGWRFNAEVDGRVGVVSTYSPSSQSEGDAAEQARRQLEMDPDQLEGIS